MNQTKIQLIGTNAGFLDVKENTATPLTFAVADIKDLSKKKGAFSKSITLAGTKNNNKLLGNYFDVNVQAGTFDVNKIVECNILQNDVPVLQNGILQLVSVNKNQKNGKHDDEITYTVLVKDNTSDFFTQINNKELTDLNGFEWMNHIYTANTVIDSFDNTISNGYKYIMPYTPEGQTTLDDASLDLTEFSPGIYAKIYFDKIFQEAGYSYSWPTMDDTSINFSKLIIPFNGEKPVVNAVEVLDYTAEVQNNTSQTISTRTQNVSSGISNRFEIVQSTTNLVLMPNEISDPSNRWNSLANRYTPPNLPSNQNSIEIEYELDWELITNSFGTAYLKNYNTSSPFDCSIIPSIKMRRTGTSQILASTNILDGNNFIKLPDGTFIPNGVNTIMSGTMSFTQLAQGIDPAFSIEVAGQIYTSSGWMFKASNSIGSTNRTSTSFGLRIVNIRAKIKTMVEGTYGYNIPVDMKRYVPQKVKQSEYLKSIFTMFNLFAEVDKDNPRRINLVPRDKYYDDGKINDWTKKLVKNQPQEIKFLPEISSKIMTLTYKEDSDISNKIYKEATGEIYGQQKFTFDNEFVKEDKKTEIMFSPTPIFNTSFGAVCPMWLGGAPKCNLRILYDGGQYSCNTYNIVNYRLNSGTINQVATSVYPYVGHWDKPVNPTFDLNFGVCDYYFRSDNFGSLTNNNLFNLHWRRTLNQINTGKIMTAYFNLNETDILNLKLNDKIRIDNSWWNINKVQDYDANANKPTKVELISIDDTLKIPFQSRRIKQIRDLSTDLIAVPIRTLTKERDKFLTVNLSPYDIDVRGKYNYILSDVTSATVVGDGNLISANSQVYGDNNVIAAESTVTGNNNVVTEDGGGSIVNGNEITITVPDSNNNTPIASSTVNYVRGWQGERELGNSINVGKAQGRILLTNGSNMITGINTLFSNTNNDGIDNTYEITVFDSDGIPKFISINNYTGDTIAEIFEIYSDNQFINSLGTTWSGITGEYDWYSYFIPQANGDFSTAFGYANQANGDFSTAFGINNKANAVEATAFGRNNKANGNTSTAFGRNNEVNGVGSTAFGLANQANGQDSTTIGQANQANGYFSTAIGLRTITNSMGEVALGSYNENITGSTITTVSTDRIFSIGIGNNIGPIRRDGFRLYKNGAAYLYPSALSGVTNGNAGFMKMDENSNLHIHNGSNWNEVSFAKNLQEVTDNGNSTSNYVELNGGFESQFISGSTQNNISMFDEINISHIKAFPPFSYSGSTLNLSDNGFGINGISNNIINTNFAYLKTENLTSDRNYQFPDNSGTLALTSDLAGGSPVWKKSGLVNNADAVNQKIYRTNTVGLIGSGVTYSTGPTQADIDNETLGTSFGHVFGGGTAGFIQLLGNGNNGGNPNVFIGRNTNASATSQLTFTSVASTSYNGWTGDKNLFRFKNGYISGNETLVDIGTQRSIFYKEVKVPLIKKDNTSTFPSTSGGNFFIGGTGGYDAFDFYSLDGSDQDSFGVVQIYSNPEEGNVIRHTSLDNQINAIVQINQNDMYFRHQYGGQNTSIYIDGSTDKIRIEGTQNKFADLGTSLITGTKTFEFPNASGILAVMRSSAPASATATGAVGEYFADSSYLYVCIATDTWVRTTVASW